MFDGRVVHYVHEEEATFEEFSDAPSHDTKLDIMFDARLADETEWCNNLSNYV